MVDLETPSTRAASVGETVMQPSGMVDKNLWCSSDLVIAKESRREPDGPTRFASVLPNSAASVCSNQSPTVPCVLDAHTRLTHRVTHRVPSHAPSPPVTTPSDLGLDLAGGRGPNLHTRTSNPQGAGFEALAAHRWSRPPVHWSR